MTSSYANHASSKAYIALGSNEGNRIQNIETACHELDDAGLQVLRTSNLYETEPMYVEDQPEFINGACEVRHALNNHYAGIIAHKILRRLK